MQKLKLQTPSGVQDYLPTECYNKKLIEGKIKSCFILSGYDEIETPSFEYYDLFSSAIGGKKQENTVKFLDNGGKILALRPDMTLPIARIAASKLQNFPARLCYIGNAYGSEGAFYGSQREFTQAGVEFIGDESPYADAEVIALAIEALKAAGLKSFQIDMGQVEFFKGLMEQAGLTKEQSEELREHVDQKNDVAVEIFLKRYQMKQSLKETIARLPALYGGEEVFDLAYSFSRHPRCIKAIDNLKQVYNLLCQYGMQEYISVDFGMLQSIDYYSGIIFKGISDRLGYSLLSGGRYDNLVGAFGKELCATGFALGIKRTLIALEREDALSQIPQIDFAIWGKNNQASYLKAMELRAMGKRTVIFSGERQEMIEFCSKTGAQLIYLEG